MDITVYLPDELGQWAKDGKYNLSRLLRDMLERFQEQEKHVTQMLEGATEHKLNLENEEGQPYVGTITGKRIAKTDTTEVFLTDKENVVVYDVEKLEYYVEDGQVSLEDLIGDQSAYIEAMHALGREVVVDLEI